MYAYFVFWVFFESVNSETLAYPNNQQDNRFYCHYGRLFGENVTFIVVLFCW